VEIMGVDIRTLQAYGYVIFTIFLVVILYAYIYHRYSSEKKGERDYEKYSDIALHDEIDDKPVEGFSSHDSEVIEKKEK
jgi:cytochrome c oxidase cbb3-type subunit 4